MTKKTKAIESRLTEIRLKTLKPEEMLNKYLGEDVVKKYKEDFTDQDTGEVKTIEKKEVLHKKGTLINQDVLAKIKFDIASGDIKEPIEVTNQNREAFEYSNTWMHPWLAKVAIGEKDKNVKFLLYGQHIDNVLLILRDYIELNFKGGFTISEVKRFDDCVILEDTLSDKMSEDDIAKAYLRGEISMMEYVNAQQTKAEDSAKKSDEKKYYQLDLKVRTKEGSSEYEHTSTFVVHTFDTERALIVVNAYLKMLEDERVEDAKKHDRTYEKKSFSLLIEKANPIPVGCFIPLEFSKVYAEDK